MLGKRFRRTTSMSHLGPGAVAPVVATPAEKTQGVPIPHSVPPKAARPLIFQAQSHFEATEERVDVCFGDVNMAVTPFEAASAQVRRPVCHANDGEVDRCEDAASMEVTAAGWEENERGAIVSCNGENESMQRSGVCCSDGLFVDRSLLAGGMQSMQAHEGMMSQCQGHAPGLLLMPHQMGLWITQSSMQYGSQGHGKLKQPSISPVDFLDVCFYCKRRLRHERDIFIYRGDTAFCSEECRHRQIVKDERRSSRANGSKRGGSAAARARSSSSSETAVAA